MTQRRRVVVGVGNRFRRDDGAGLELIERLHGRVTPDVELRTLEGELTPLVDVIAAAELVIVVDAAAGPDSPGAVHRFDAVTEPLAASMFGVSTHAFGLAETIELARTLATLTGRVLVYGIIGADFSAGEGLSATVAAVIEPVAQRILGDLAGAWKSTFPVTGLRST